MTDDASTAYICIYCPFNSNNLEALENHLTSKQFIQCHLALLCNIYMSLGIHGHGCQDISESPPLPPAQSSTLSNSINRTGKREAPDDEQVLVLFQTCSFSILSGYHFCSSSLHLSSMVSSK